MDAPIYKTDGKTAGKVTLPEAVFGAKWNADLVHQVVTGMQANARQTVAHTKDRSDVRGGGRKPWRQKGTGRARHGSRRSPIWKGGGVTFGPRKERDFSKKINKKMKTQALYSVLSKKFADGEILFVDDIKISAPKTADAKTIFDALAGVEGFIGLSQKKDNTAFVTLSGNDENVKRSFANFGNVEVDEVRNLNALDALSYTYLIITKPDESVDFLAGKSSK